MTRTIKYGPNKGETTEQARYCAMTYADPGALRTRFIECDTWAEVEAVREDAKANALHFQYVDRAGNTERAS
jgi:hypothetical protein